MYACLGDVELTGISGGDGGRAAKVAAGGERVLVVVAVEGVGRMVVDGIRVEAAPACLDRRAVYAAVAARIVQRHLQSGRARALARHAPRPATPTATDATSSTAAAHAPASSTATAGGTASSTTAHATASSPARSTATAGGTTSSTATANATSADVTAAVGVRQRREPGGRRHGVGCGSGRGDRGVRGFHHRDGGQDPLVLGESVGCFYSPLSRSCRDQKKKKRVR